MNEQTNSSTSMMTKQNNAHGQMLLMNATVLSSADSMAIDRSSDNNNLNNDRRPVTSNGAGNEYILPADSNSGAALI